MKKLLVLLATSIIILAGCGEIDYNDPQIYIDAIKDGATADSDALGAVNEYLTLVEAEENASLYVQSYKGVIGAILKVYPGNTKELYNDFLGEVELVDFVTLEASVRDAITTYNGYSEVKQNAQTKIFNTGLKVTTKMFDAMVIIIESDEFATLLETADSFEELYNTLKDYYSEIEGIDTDELLENFDI